MGIQVYLKSSDLNLEVIVFRRLYLDLNDIRVYIGLMYIMDVHSGNCILHLELIHQLARIKIAR